MHLEAVIASTSTASSSTFVPRYLYELERAIANTNARLGCCITVSTCCDWGAHLRGHWQAVNHAQVGSVAAGRETLLSSTLENMLTQLVSINESLGRLEDAHVQLSAFTSHDQPVQAQLSRLSTAAEPLIPPPVTATTLAGCLLNWYTNHICQTVKGKKEQNKRAEAKAAVNIMMILYQKPIAIPQEPSRCDVADAATYQTWKDSIWTLAVAMDSAVSERLHAFDKKKPTRKAASLRKRWKLLKTAHPEAVGSFIAQFLRMKANGQIIDACTPATHLWDASDMS
ncbi:hypothetical protein PF007_g1278 [Phytophthora fragariae]|uniref:Uncharacterized protein n=1 Tax=Phytophthora fragariae TaxID=53985 RepID=A0A6A3TKU0_9STRA|nr:hypothetical protein PF007_g1278 [Phytophthora fragariae]